MIGRPVTDLTGRVYDQLTVLARDGEDRYRKVWWRCRCSCGELWRVRGSDLTGGKTRSCGCRRVAVSRRRMISMLQLRRRAAAALRSAA